MACRGKLRWSIALVIPLTVAACGLYTPDKDPFTSDAPDGGRYSVSRQGSYESRLVDHVTCEISKALFETQERWGGLPSLYNKWGTAVTLTITVEDQSGLNPGVTAIAPLKNVVYSHPASDGGNVTLPQSFSFSIGATASVNALRTETIQFTVKNSDAISYANCGNTGSGVLIDGDLKIREFVFDKAQVATEANGLWDSGKTLPYNAWTEEITFVAAYGGSVTPTWKLARVSANASTNLVVAERTNTNDLVITLGPLKCLPPPPPKYPSMSFSQLLDAVEEKKVVRVLIKGSVVYSQFAEGKTYQTYAPNDPTFIQRLHDKNVFIEAKPGNEQNTQACPKDAPVALVDAAMNQHNARVAANAIAVATSNQSH